MARSMSLVLGFVGLSLVAHSPAAPAPTPKPKPKGAEALLYVKRVPGRTDKEQAEIRRVVRYHLLFGFHKWMNRPETKIPGLEGPFSTIERAKWEDKNVQFTWVEDTWVLRITCRAGTPCEQAEFVNNAVKHSVAWYEQHKERLKDYVATNKDAIGKIEMTFRWEDNPKVIERNREDIEDLSKGISKVQRLIADLSEIVILDLAEVPPK